jgi:hypothetical protein
MPSFTINAEDVTIKPYGSNIVEVSVDTDLASLLYDVSVNDIIDHFGICNILNEIYIDDVVHHFTSDDLLGEIGQDAAEKYWNLVPGE